MNTEQNGNSLVAVLTGAGGGIGRATALKLAQQGIRLILLGGNNVEKLEETRKLVQELTEVFCLPGDLTDLSFLADAAQTVAQIFGKVDVLINNAGMALNRPFEEVSEEEFDKIFHINVKTPYFLTQKMLPLLKQSEQATVINISSVVGHSGYPNQSAYSASKHALFGFTKSLANEFYKENIRVHAISPGGVYTDMVKISRPDLTPEGMILPEDIAEIVWFFLSHRGNAVVDEIIVHRVNKEPFSV
ncbi:MAG: SDR family oxidoreductase [Ruminococcaceae bacterium]|nr:SDR family oxidoreductase [Oscillospiraceae bacterium]